MRGDLVGADACPGEQLLCGLDVGVGGVEHRPQSQEPVVGVGGVDGFPSQRVGNLLGRCRWGEARLFGGCVGVAFGPDVGFECLDALQQAVGAGFGVVAVGACAARAAPGWS